MMKNLILAVLILISVNSCVDAQKKKQSLPTDQTFTHIEVPTVPDSIMYVSVYPTVKVKPGDIPVSMKGIDVDFVKKYRVPTDGKIITTLLQKAIDETSAKGGGKIHIAKGDYQLGNIYMRSNVHLLIDKDVIIRPRSNVFGVGTDADLDNIVENVSIQGVGGRFKVLLPEEMNGFSTKFTFIRSVYVKNFYYANFDIYDHKTVVSSLTFGPAAKNAQNFIGPTNGLVMNITVVDAHYGYGLVQSQAGRNIRFYNLHGIGGITLRMETGSKSMNRTQFGGVHDFVGQNISVANGHGGVLCGSHGMKNGIATVRDVTAFSSGTGFGIGDGQETIDGVTHYGSFSEGTSVRNVTAIFGFKAQIKTKELWRIPEEYLSLIGKPGRRAIIEDAPAHTCVRIATTFPVEYDLSTFVAKGFKYGDPICITEGKIKDEEKQKRFSKYIMEKYKLKTIDSKKMK